MFKNYKKYKGERSFGCVFFVFFSILSFFPTLNGASINLNFLFAGLFFLLIGFLMPFLFVLPNKLWIMFGNLLGKITTPIIVSLIYVFVLIPTSFILKIFKKDLLDEIINKNKKSYWIERKESHTDFKRQF